jgi:integrase
MSKMTRKDWEELFPELNLFEIAQVMAKAEQESGELGTQRTQINQASKKTIGEILKVVRAEYMQHELERPGARIQEDGTMRIKDTTTFRTYDTNWKRLEAKYSELAIGELNKQIVKDFCFDAMQLAKATHAKNRKLREEKGLPVKEEDCHQAYNRALDTVATIVRHAIENGMITVSPLVGIKRKPLSEGDRHGLTQEQVEELFDTALNGGNDPALDYLIIWSILELACRSGGILHMQLGDIDMEHQTIRVREKLGKSRKQPVTQALAETLIAFATERGAKLSTDPVFYFHQKGPGQGRPLSRKRYETLWNRISKELPWVAEKRVSNHWIRHTTLSWLDRAGTPETIVSKYAGHGSANVTQRYTKVRLEEISRAHEQLFGKVHPLA